MQELCYVKVNPCLARPPCDLSFSGRTDTYSLGGSAPRPPDTSRPAASLNNENKIISRTNKSPTGQLSPARNVVNEKLFVWEKTKAAGQRYTRTQCFYSYMYPYVFSGMHIVSILTEIVLKCWKVRHLRKLSFWCFVWWFWILSRPIILFSLRTIVLDRFWGPKVLGKC